MPLPAYTTTIAPKRTAREINELLAAGGANTVTTEYRDSQQVGLRFTVPTAHGPAEFRLPVAVEPVLATLKQQKIAPRYQTWEQAERTAWRIVKNWLDAQLALIKIGMATLDQLMLAHMTTEDGRTVYEHLVQQRKLSLESASG